VLLVLTGCHGEGELSLRIVRADTREHIFENQPRLVHFAGSPNDAAGIVFNIVNCSFPVAGVYWVQCIYSRRIIEYQQLAVVV
jgi:hypothetical protein